MEIQAPHSLLRSATSILRIHSNNQLGEGLTLYSLRRGGLPLLGGSSERGLSVRMAVHLANVMWRLSAILLGLGTLVPAYLTGRERMVRSWGGRVSGGETIKESG